MRRNINPENMENKIVTFKVEQNEIHKDFRVVKYVDGIWMNEREGNWSKYKAEQKLKMYRTLLKQGLTTMGDNI